MPCPRMLRTALLRLALLALLGPPFAALAAEPNSRMMEDVKLTLLARQALEDEQTLGPALALVSVRDGVATLSGTLPSMELMQRSLKRVRAIKGLRDVRNELQVVDPDGPTQPLKLPPIDRQPRGPGTLANREDGPATAQPSSSRPSRSVELLPPEPVSRKVPLPEVANEPLRQAVQKLRDGEPRFRGLVFDVQGRIVYVLGTDAASQELARRVAQLAGVERVVTVQR